MIDFDAGKQPITLADFIRDEEDAFPQATGLFSDILLTIALGTKIVSRGVNRAGLASMLGMTGDRNVQGEDVQKLDLYADRVFEKTLGRSGQFYSMVSEEREDVFPANKRDRSSRYVIAFDPLDGSSNIDTTVSIGSIWSIYRRLENGDQLKGADEHDFLQPGFEQVAAGYAIYGSSTVFVMTTGSGVNCFTLDPTIGEFILTHENMQMPSEGTIYSCNEANLRRWSPGVQAFVEGLKNPQGSSNYSARYVGSLVADFHRTMLKGGIYMYPATEGKPDGKLRLLYECAPLAFIAEQAGGKAVNGTQRILDIVPGSIHQRCPLFIGSSDLVDRLVGCCAQGAV